MIAEKVWTIWLDDQGGGDGLQRRSTKGFGGRDLVLQSPTVLRKTTWGDPWRDRDVMRLDHRSVDGER